MSAMSGAPDALMPGGNAGGPEPCRRGDAAGGRRY